MTLFFGIEVDDICGMYVFDFADLVSIVFALFRLE